MSTTALPTLSWSAQDTVSNGANARLPRTTGTTLPSLSAHPNPIQQSTIVLDNTTLPRSRNIVSTIQIAAAAANGNQISNVSKKRPETLFGPDVGGPASDEKGWLAGTSVEDTRKVSAGVADADTKATVSLDTVRQWVERAKKEEGLHPTTTLQALVNLKRPTLHLTPVVQHFDSSASHDIEAVSGQRHVLTFSYDASTPYVRITLSLHPHPSLAQKPIVLYQGQHDGGFAKTFRLPEDQALDLAGAIEKARSASLDEGSTDDGKDLKDHAPPTSAVELQAPASEGATSNVQAQTVVDASQTGIMQAQTSPAAINSRRRRFPFLHSRARRNQEADIEAQILAEASGNTFLANQRANGDVIEMQAASRPTGEHTLEDEKTEEDGMRVLITIDAVGPDGHALASPNSQLTHILIMGMTTSTAHETGTAAEGTEGHSAAEATHRRLWVIKVVRREAIIGSYSFLLKEIYGLASSSASEGPTNTPNAITYPPPAAAPSDDPYASTPNECIVCLTSPRDVVLLPCRHLVVCRECAVGMIEFGAGGKVARREETTETSTDANAAEGATAGDAAAATPVPAPAPAQPTRERRKKKAKGWFCPVCRQPYTSLLRLALPASVNAEAEQGHPLSRVPSVAGGTSLRRVSSRATLPERGERMLERITPNTPGQDDYDNEREGETEGERRERAQQEEMDREELASPQFVLGDEITHPTPIHSDAEATTEFTSSDSKSVEGAGWRAVV